MITINVLDTAMWQHAADALVVFVEDNQLSSALTHDVLQLVPNAASLLQDRKFTGKNKSIVIVPTSSTTIKYVIFAGLGKKTGNNFKLENMRRAIANMARSFASFSIKTVSFEMPDAANFGISMQLLAQNIASTLLMADYLFDEFITDKDRKENHNEIITIFTNDVAAVKEGIAEGLIIGEAVNTARHWVDLPPIILHPSYLAKQAQEIAAAGNLTCTVFSEEDVIKMGMGGLAGVSAGSEQDCKLVILEYKVADKNAPTIALVGKGITFDSGGLSIKPAGSMETMKEDMSGAAAVISTMNALSKLKPTVNVIGIAPITENLPSGKATKPGDILRFYNGKTAEVLNTDAEGRLILADALSYTVKHYKPDLIIDAATLTGACAHALGPFFSGLFSEHEELAAKIQESAARSGDYVWRLPLTDDYKGAVKSEVADLCNIGRSHYKAGGTTAACFLQHFVDDVPWAHLDIAGTAFDVPDVPYYRKHSGTGVPVRLFIDFVMNYKK